MVEFDVNSLVKYQPLSSEQLPKNRKSFLQAETAINAMSTDNKKDQALLASTEQGKLKYHVVNLNDLPDNAKEAVLFVDNGEITATEEGQGFFTEDSYPDGKLTPNDGFKSIINALSTAKSHKFEYESIVLGKDGKYYLLNTANEATLKALGFDKIVIKETGKDGGLKINSDIVIDEFKKGKITTDEISRLIVDDKGMLSISGKKVLEDILSRAKPEFFKQVNTMLKNKDNFTNTLLKVPQIYLFNARSYLGNYRWNNSSRRLPWSICVKRPCNNNRNFKRTIKRFSYSICTYF